MNQILPKYYRNDLVISLFIDSSDISTKYNFHAATSLSQKSFHAILVKHIRAFREIPYKKDAL